MLQTEICTHPPVDLEFNTSTQTYVVICDKLRLRTVPYAVKVTAIDCMRHMLARGGFKVPCPPGCPLGAA